MMHHRAHEGVRERARSAARTRPWGYCHLMRWRTSHLSFRRATVAAISAIAMLFAAVPVAAQTAVEDVERPSVPVITFAQQVNSDEIHVAWDLAGIPWVAYYRFYSNGRPVGEYPGVTSEPFEDFGDDRSETDIEFQPTTSAGRAWIQVSAVDIYGDESPRSAPVPVHYSARAPAAPTEVSVSQQRGNAGCVVLEFRAVSDERLVTSYEVLVNGKFFASAGRRNERLYSRSHCGLTSGPKYFQVRTRDYGGSVRSRPVLADIPPPPSGFTVSHEGGQATFSWDQTGAPATAIRIFDVGYHRHLVTASADETSLTMPITRSPLYDGRHFYQLQAVSADGFLSPKTPPIFIEDTDPTEFTASFDRSTRCMDFAFTTRTDVDVAEYHIVSFRRRIATQPGSVAGTGSERRTGQVCGDDDSNFLHVELEAITVDGVSKFSHRVQLPYGGRLPSPPGFDMSYDGPELTFTWDAPTPDDEVVYWTLFDKSIEIAKIEDTSITTFRTTLMPSRYGDGLHRFQLQATDAYGLDSYLTTGIHFRFPDEEI